LKALRKEMKLKGYKSHELAKCIGVSKTTIYKWLRGDFLPNPDNIEILKGLGFSDTACLEPSKEVEV
jgi:transcriptional regulator with XRE-family HTH domain